MDAAAIARYARQIALPEVGPDGQARLCAARAIVVGADLAAEVAATYLRAAGVGSVRPEPAPASGDEWVTLLAEADLLVRSGFDDDASLAAAARRGIPVVVVHARPDLVDVVSFPRRAPRPNAELDVPARPASFSSDGGAAGVLAGTLAAAEALHALLGPAVASKTAVPPTRLLRLPLDGGEPSAQEIPSP